MKAVTLRNNYGNQIAIEDAETGTVAATVAPFDPICAADLTDDGGGLAATSLAVDPVGCVTTDRIAGGGRRDANCQYSRNR
jgi:hypothetical protein